VSTPPTPNEKLLELLADRAVDSLDVQDQAELDALLAEHPEADDGTFDHAAAALMIALAGPIEPMPDQVRSRVLASLSVDASPPASEPLKLAEPAARFTRPARPNFWAWSGWLAAAACLVIAVLVVQGRAPALQQKTDLAQALREFVQTAPDIKRTAWKDWDNPEQTGVTGEVYWSESQQRGFVTFRGLAPNDPNREKYQLWIIDHRGMDQRISGALFDCPTSEAECIVEITSPIQVHDAAAFAVTIEKPEGVWVSDMSRRVVIATLDG